MPANVCLFVSKNYYVRSKKFALVNLVQISDSTKQSDFDQAKLNILAF